MLAHKPDNKAFAELLKTVQEKCFKLWLSLKEIDSSGARYETASLSGRVLISDLRDILDNEEKIKDTLETAANIYDLIRKSQADMESLANRRAISLKGFAEVELHSVKQILLGTREKIQAALQSVNDISEELRTDITNENWYMALSSISPEQFQIYLYMQKLFLECVSVSAVSSRSKLIIDNFMQ